MRINAPTRSPDKTESLVQQEQSKPQHKILRDMGRAFAKEGADPGGEPMVVHYQIFPAAERKHIMSLGEMDTTKD